MAMSSVDAGRILAEAEKAGRVLAVDHTFVFMGAVTKVSDLIAAGTLGDLYYYDSVRINLGNFQRDVNVVWDLAVHDLSILACWVGEKPREVSCIGSAHIAGQPVERRLLDVDIPQQLHRAPARELAVAHQDSQDTHRRLKKDDRL